MEETRHHGAIARTILGEVGIHVTSERHVGRSVAATGAVDPVTRMVRRHSAVATRIIMKALLAAARRSDHPAALSTTTIRAFADLPRTWSGHAEDPWFATAVEKMDIASTYEALLNMNLAPGRRYVMMREAIILMLEPEKARNLN